jgi:hypothetical protein
MPNGGCGIRLQRGIHIPRLLLAPPDSNFLVDQMRVVPEFEPIPSRKAA